MKQSRRTREINGIINSCCSLCFSYSKFLFFPLLFPPWFGRFLRCVMGNFYVLWTSLITFFSFFLVTLFINSSLIHPQKLFFNPLTSATYNNEWVENAVNFSHNYMCNNSFTGRSILFDLESLWLDTVDHDHRNQVTKIQLDYRNHVKTAI